MISSTDRRDLVDRLRHTFITANYGEIDEIIAGLQAKDNFEALCEEFFHGCRIDSRGSLISSGFFADKTGSASLVYAMYALLGCSPETFLLKHRVSRIKLVHKDLKGCFRLPRGLFSLPNLEALIIRGIGISRLPDNLSQSHKLRILDLTGNRFAKFPNQILKLNGLSALNLSFNLLTGLPQKIDCLGNLRVLSLRGNLITKLPGDWHQLQYLKKMDLSMNRLQSVPDSLRTLTSLQELRLFYNDLPACVEADWEQTVRSGANKDGSKDSVSAGR